MRASRRFALAGLVALVARCGTDTKRPNPTVARHAAGFAEYAQAAEASCATGEANGKPLKASCVFVLTDGRRFRCPERIAHAVQTATPGRARACRAIAPLHLPAAARRVTAAIESAQACLISHKVRAIGNAVLPPLTDPSSPDGELIAGYLPNGALIAFYRDSNKADQLETGLLSNAHRLHAQVERRGTPTIFWWRPPTAPLRRAVHGCLPDSYPASCCRLVTPEICLHSATSISPPTTSTPLCADLAYVVRRRWPRSRSRSAAPRNPCK
jgi:hypothetical protein